MAQVSVADVAMSPQRAQTIAISALPQPVTQLSVERKHGHRHAEHNWQDRARLHGNGC
jgi:hypothetical protein